MHDNSLCVACETPLLSAQIRENKLRKFRQALLPTKQSQRFTVPFDCSVKLVEKQMKIAHLDIALEREVSSERMTFESVVSEDSAEVWMIREINPVQIPHLKTITFQNASAGRGSAGAAAGAGGGTVNMVVAPN